MKKLLKSTLIGLSALSLSFSSGCGLGFKKSKYISVIAGNQSQQFMSAVEKGASDAAAEAGFKVIPYSSQRSLLEQISSVNDSIEKGVKCIIIDPIDVNALDGVFEKAAENHIRIITLGTENAKRYSEHYRKNVTACVGTNYISTGAIAARKAVSMIDSSSKVITVNSTVNDIPSNERVQGFEEQLLNNSGSDAMLLRSQYKGEDLVSIVESIKNQVLENTGVKLIFASNFNDTLCSCQAVEELSMTGKIFIIGCGYDEQLDKYIRSGTLSAVCVENPYNMGYLGVRFTKKLLDGTQVSVENDTGISYVNAENIDSEEVKLLLSQII